MLRTCSSCNQSLDESEFVKKVMVEPDVCKRCRARESRRKYNEKNVDKVRAMYMAKRADRLASQAAWKLANPEKIKQYRKTSYQRNPQAWKIAARKREFMKAQRSPSWGAELTDLVFAEAVDLRLARGLVTGIGWEIDHVIPLQGKRVSGLHVWNNLRVIPQILNRRKYNTYDIV